MLLAWGVGENGGIFLAAAVVAHVVVITNMAMGSRLHRIRAARFGGGGELTPLLAPMLVLLLYDGS